MTTRRKQIRNKVVSILKRINAVPRDNIKSSRSLPYEKKFLPAISVYTDEDEIIKELSSAPRELMRQLEVIVEIAVADEYDDKAADKLDDICEDIEDVLSSHTALTGGKVDSFVSDDFLLDRVDIEEQGENIEQPIHIATMTWNAIYTEFMPRDRRHQEQKDFTRADAQWQVGHNDEAPTMPEADRAEDQVNIPQ